MIEKVESLLACPGHPRYGVAVTQGEAKLHINLLGSLTRDPVRKKPVVLVGLHHTTNLESMDRPVVLIHLCDGVPLKRNKKRKEEEMKG